MSKSNTTDKSSDKKETSTNTPNISERTTQWANDQFNINTQNPRIASEIEDTYRRAMEAKQPKTSTSATLGAQFSEQPAKPSQSLS